MKRKFIGDCMDFYKRGFLSALLLKPGLAAVPMVTGNQWNDADRHAYAGLLCVHVIEDGLIPSRRDRQRRSDYFCAALTSGMKKKDLFIDPDTGLRGPNQRPPRDSKKYVFADELALVLPDRSTRVAVVYDHGIGHSDLRGAVAQVRAKLQQLRDNEMNLLAFAYVAQAAMVVVGRDRRRIETLRERAEGLWNPTWWHPPLCRIVSNF
jgi:hypothetical protein